MTTKVLGTIVGLFSGEWPKIGTKMEFVFKPEHVLERIRFTTYRFGQKVYEVLVERLSKLISTFVAGHKQVLAEIQCEGLHFITLEQFGCPPFLCSRQRFGRKFADKQSQLKARKEAVPVN